MWGHELARAPESSKFRGAVGKGTQQIKVCGTWFALVDSERIQPVQQLPEESDAGEEGSEEREESDPEGEESEESDPEGEESDHKEGDHESVAKAG